MTTRTTVTEDNAKNKILIALNKSCSYYLREVNFGTVSWWYSGETGRARANKIIQHVSHAGTVDGRVQMHWMLALACMESNSNVLIEKYIAPFLERSAVFSLDEIHLTLNSLHKETHKPTRLIEAIKALIKLRLTIDQIQVADIIRENIDDPEVNADPKFIMGNAQRGDFPSTVIKERERARN